MCGRFALAIDSSQLRLAFPWAIIDEEIQPRYNIAPTQPVMAITNQLPFRMNYHLWGLIPSWVKNPKLSNLLINARSETLAEKPSFRNAYRRRRCIIPVTGFYEWRKNISKKSEAPYYIHLENNQPFAFAGLWEKWIGPQGEEILSCSIITTKANKLIASIHERMPVILERENYEDWLNDREMHPSILAHLLQPFHDEKMECYPVSSVVNSVHIDTPDCIIPNIEQSH